MKIRNKIIAIYLPLLVIPLFFVTYTSNYIFTRSILEKTQKNIANESSLIIMRISSVLSNAETCADMMSKDINRLYRDYNAKPDDPVSFVPLGNQIIAAINIDLRAFSDIESAAFVDIYNNLITPNPKFVKYDGDLSKNDMIESINNRGPPTNVWFPMQTRDYFVTDKNMPVVTVGKKVLDIWTGMTLGYIFLNIKEDTFSSVFPDAGSGYNKGYFIMDEQGKIISSKDKSNLLKSPNNSEVVDWVKNKKASTVYVDIENKSYMLTSSNVEKMGWELISQIPVSELTRDININSIIIGIVALVLIIIALLGAFFLSRLIANPAIRLTKVAKDVRGGNLDVSCKVNSNDEIGILALVFNEMVIKVKELLSEIKLEQKMKREYELALIQAQIKPHFLYNTLDLIYVLCEMGNTSVASETTKALADFYRISLSKGREIITIHEELKITNDYLFIQKERYSDILDFSIEVSEEILHFPILKLTLQPLVENSIYHGLKPNDQFGRIVIQGYALESEIIIKVIDDGVGMSDKFISEILNSDKNPVSRESFGLKSVDERIKLYFGEEYGINICSALDKGTVVTITIPKKLGGSFNA